MDLAKEAIVKRSTKLNHVIFDPKNTACCGINRETLLDSMKILLDESRKKNRRNNLRFKSFSSKFENSFCEINKLRVNLSDFESKTIIGRGHFGEVRVVREKSSGDFYAMKTLHKDETLTQSHVAFYEEERDIMAKSSGPWLTKLQYAFQDNVNLYLVMEYHPGGDMLGLITRYDDLLPEDMAKFYLAEMVQAIESLHTMGYVHRDIKPDNVLVDRTGHIKLADFGSAAKLQSNGKVSSEMPVGTPDYIAPEVLTSLNCSPLGGDFAVKKGYGIECDWWSLGIVAFQMLFGYTPFTDDRIVTTYSNIMNFKKCLKFPRIKEDSKVSNEAISMIKKLLDDPKTRIGYKGLRNLEFFQEVDWDNLLQSVPPFVPTVNAKDDTSNFEEFEKEPFGSSTNFAAQNEDDERGFTGRHLPFVGFTFVEGSASKDMSERHPSFLNSSFESSFVESPARNRIGKVESQLAGKKREVKELQGRVNEYELREMTKHEERVRLQEENAELKQRVECLEIEVSDLTKMTKAEHNARIASENKACTLVEIIKEKYKEQVRLKQLEVEKMSEECSQLQARHEEEIEKSEKYQKINEQNDTQLKKCRDNFESYKNNREKKKLDCKDGLEDIHSKLEKLSQNTNEQIGNLQNKLHNAEVEKNNAVKRAEELESKVQSKNNVFEKKERKAAGDNILRDHWLQTREYCVELETQLAKLKLNEQNVDELNTRLYEEIEQNNRLKLELSELEVKVNEYEKRASKLECVDIARLEDKVESLAKKFSESPKSIDIQIENRVEGGGRPIVVKDQLNNLHNIQLRLENCVKTLESEATFSLAMFNKEETDLHQENLHLRNKIDQLESKMIGITDDPPEKIVQLTEKLRKSEEEANESKLTARIKSREVKSLEEKLKWSRECQRELRNSSRVSDENINKLKEAEKLAKKTIEELKVKLEKKNSEMDEVQKQLDTEKAKLNSKILVLEENCGNTKTLEEKVARSEGRYGEVSNRIEALNRELKILTSENEQLKKRLEKTEGENCDKVKKIENLQLCLNVKNSTSKMLEEQIEDFETLIKMHEDVKENLECEIKSLKTKMNDVWSENTERKMNFDKINKEKEVNKETIENFRGRIDALNRDHRAECEALKADGVKQKHEIINLNEKLRETEQENERSERSSKNYEEKVERLERYLVEIKEEASKHITQVSSLKGSNLKLSQALADALDRHETTESELKDLSAEFDGAVTSYEHEKVKMMETIAQQTKLIDFLQQKTENLKEKRKKGIFGAMKHSVKSDGGFSSPIYNHRGDIPASADKKKHYDRDIVHSNLHEERFKNVTEAENESSKSTVPTSPKTRAVLSALVSSPGPNESSSTENSPAGTNDNFRRELKKPQKQRMHHNIPHRFQQFRTMRPIKCCACLDTVRIGKQATKCQECDILCHAKCTHAVPSTCGLPNALVDHFTSAVVRNGLFSSPSVALDRDSDLYEGWVKIASSSANQGWQKYYMQLNGSQIGLYDGENVKDHPPSQYFEFDPKKSRDDRSVEIIVGGAISHSELVGTAKTDVPYIFKLVWQSKTTCWPEETLYIMAESLSEKQLWVLAIESVIAKFLANSDDRNSSNSKVLGNMIVEPQTEATTINCSLIIEKRWLLVGSAQGLFFHDLKREENTKLERIFGLDNVYQMFYLTSLNLVLFLYGQSRQIKYVTKEELVSSIDHQSGMEPRDVCKAGQVVDCHLFGAMSASAEKTFFVIATTDYVSLYKWDVRAYTFVKIKDIRTVEPCSCIHFTKNSFMFGSNKFFEVDLLYYSIEEFLDESDISLAYATFGAERHTSFPTAIAEMSHSNQPIEYLLCFHEFGVFVDEFGRSSRQTDIKWSRLPIFVAYCAPYLYLVHFNSIEICKIPTNPDDHHFVRSVVDVSNPYYLGPALDESAIYVAISCEGETRETQILCFRGNMDDDKSEPKCLNDGVSLSSSDCIKVDDQQEDEFSFTDSMVASLDEKLSDDE